MMVATRGIAAIGAYFPFGISADLPDFPTGAQMVSGADEARRAAREQLGQRRRPDQGLRRLGYDRP